MLGSAWSLWRGRPEREEARTHSRLARIALVAGLGFCVGVLTGYFGVGGGCLIVPALVLLLDVPVRLAIGASLLIITVTALAGLAGHLVSGGVSWPIALAFGGAGMVGAWLGTRAGRDLTSDTLSRAFAVMLVAVALFLLAKNGVAIVG